MKTCVTFVLLLIFCSANAQVTEKDMKRHLAKVAKSKAEGTVLLSLDTIYKAGISYAVLEEKVAGLASNYKLFSLKGKELLNMTYECTAATSTSIKTCYHVFLFLQSGKRGEMMISLGTEIETIIVGYDLVKNNEINPAGENKFLMSNPPKFSSKSSYATVERSRSGPVSLSDTALKQDYKIIGSVTKSSSSANGTTIYTVSYFLPDGTKVAEATGEGIDCKSWRVVTMKDNLPHTVTTTTSQQEEQLAKFLSDGYYL